jgi:formylglycine-generating enzyme required for sulfatase activity
MDKRKSSQINLFKMLAMAGLFLLVSCAKPVDRHGMAAIKAAGKKFTMGQKEIANAAPIEAAIERDFAIDKTEITTGFFSRIMGNAPSYFKDDTAKPVENVTFVDAALFCNKRSELEGLAPCYIPGSWICDRTKNGYRLPTEAEWEYACRAGSNEKYFWGSKVSSKYCWYGGNGNNVTHRVATAKPNKFGLFDMSGNVWEWCDDRYYADRRQKQDSHWQLGPKTLRGGSFSSSAELVGSAARDGGEPLGKSNGVGFRCVKNL